MVLSGDLSQTLITSARVTLRAFTAADAAESFAEANARIANSCHGIRQLPSSKRRSYGASGEGMAPLVFSTLANGAPDAEV
jgi:hypothetical protein